MGRSKICCSPVSVGHSAAVVMWLYRADALSEADTEKAKELVFRKISLRLLPLLVTSFVIAYIDRTNVGFAALTMQPRGAEPQVDSGATMLADKRPVLPQGPISLGGFAVQI